MIDEITRPHRFVWMGWLHMPRQTSVVYAPHEVGRDAGRDGEDDGDAGEGRGSSKQQGQGSVNQDMRRADSRMRGHRSHHKAIDTHTGTQPASTRTRTQGPAHPQSIRSPTHPRTRPRPTPQSIPQSHQPIRAPLHSFIPSFLHAAASSYPALSLLMKRPTLATLMSRMMAPQRIVQMTTPSTGGASAISSLL